MNQIGFISNCLNMPFSGKIRLAHRLGYQTLEVACWPVGNAKQCDIDVDTDDEATVNRIREMLNCEGMNISTLAYYDNMLSEKADIRKKRIYHLKNVIKMAHKLEVPYIATYIGKNPHLSVTENFDLAAETFKPLIALAAELNVTVLIENCPMPTWNPEGNPSTITYSPELLKRTFKVLDSPNFGLNYDPSHFYWQHIDYLLAANVLAPWIKSVHVKDVTLDRNKMDRTGLFGKKVDKSQPFDFGYYQPTLPGYGDIDWLKLLRILRNNDFEGPLQVEYKNGNGYGVIKDTKRGLKMSADFLRMIIDLSTV